MSKNIRQALLRVHQQHQTLHYAAESFSSAMHELLPFLSNKPSLSNRIQHGEDEREYLNELRNNIDSYYGNKDWLEKQKTVDGLIHVNDIAPLFEVNGHLNSSILSAASKGSKDIVHWCHDFARITLQREEFAKSALKGVYGKDIDNVLSTLKEKLPELISPLAKIGKRIEQLPGGHFLEEKKGASMMRYSLHKTNYRHRSPDVKSLTKEEIAKAANLVLEMLDDVEESISTLWDNRTGEDTGFDGIGMHYEDYFELPFEKQNVIEPFTRDAFDEAEFRVARGVVRHLADMVAGIEKLMHRSLK